MSSLHLLHGGKRNLIQISESNNPQHAWSVQLAMLVPWWAWTFLIASKTAQVKHWTFLLPPLQFVFVADYCLKPDVNMASVSQFPIYQALTYPKYTLVFQSYPTWGSVLFGPPKRQRKAFRDPNTDPNTDPHKVSGKFWKTTWRIIPVSKWLWLKSPLSRVVPLPNGLFLASLEEFGRLKICCQATSAKKRVARLSVPIRPMMLIAP